MGAANALFADGHVAGLDPVRLKQDGYTANTVGP